MRLLGKKIYLKTTTKNIKYFNRLKN